MYYFDYFRFLMKNPDKIEKRPELKEFPGNLWSDLLAEHPQLAPYCDFAKITGHALRYLLEHQGQFADKCDLSTIPAEDWWQILRKQPQLADFCPTWDFPLYGWADLLQAQPQFFKRCDYICYLLQEYPTLYENWKLQDWTGYKIVAEYYTPLPPEDDHTPAEWYDIIMHDHRRYRCALCDCLLELVLQYPEIFARWCKFGRGSLYQPVYWQLTKV